VSNGPFGNSAKRQGGPDLNPVALIRDSLAGLRHPDLFLRLVILPAAGMFGAELLLSWSGLRIEIDPTGKTPPSPSTLMAALAISLVLLVFTSLFAVNWIRSLLLGFNSVPGYGLRWGTRETRYLLRAAAIAFIPALAIMLVTFVILALFGETTISGIATLILMIVYLLFMMKLSLLLPAAAVDHSFSLRDALALRGRFAAKLLATQILITLPYFLLLYLLGLFIDGLGLASAAPYASQFIFLMLNFVFLAISTGVFAFAFQAVVKGQSPGSLTV
jgi:hypothetical protein